MPIVAQTTPSEGNFVIYEEGKEVGFAREGITVNETAATTYGAGFVVGKVTATGKWKLCSPTASDGSQVAAGVIVQDNNGYANEFTVPAVTDTKVVAIVRGDVLLSKGAIRFGAGFTTQVQKDAALAQLEALNIRNTVTV